METKKQQTELFKFQNPLHQRLGRDFFLKLPKAPGVYFFYGESGWLLYVGKAKSLRDRLNSYRLAAPGRVSKKVLRMIHLAREIRWEECADETQALLRENQLLRDLQPAFNVLNTSPESYLFLGIREVHDPELNQLEFRLTRNSDPDELRPREILYGAFKNRRLTQEAYGALLRLLWCTGYQEVRFEFPVRLTRKKLPSPYVTPFPPDWIPSLKRFLVGSHPKFLTLLTERLLLNESIPRFAYTVLQQDLETLKTFYARCSHRNQMLRRHYGKEYGLKGKLIPQEKLDDLLVLNYMNKTKRHLNRPRGRISSQGE
jgi:hypothetical protein